MGRARQVTAPDGTIWTIRRQALPGVRRTLRWRRVARVSDVADPTVVADVHPAGILLGIALLVALTVAVVVVAPLAILLVEAVLVLGAAAVGLFSRVVLRRPWVVEAVPDAGGVPPLSWRVAGWRASRRAIEQVAEALRSGLEPRVGEGLGEPAARASIPPP